MPSLTCPTAHRARPTHGGPCPGRPLLRLEVGKGDVRVGKGAILVTVPPVNLYQGSQGAQGPSRGTPPPGGLQNLHFISAPLALRPALPLQPHRASVSAFQQGTRKLMMSRTRPSETVWGPCAPVAVKPGKLPPIWASSTRPMPAPSPGASESWAACGGRGPSSAPLDRWRSHWTQHRPSTLI